MRWTIYKWGCDGCALNGKEKYEEVKIPIYPGEKLPIFNEPENWNTIDGKHYCEEHIVVVICDKKVVLSTKKQ